MTSTSERQRRAMEAAKHGNSTIGIPQSVGEEFADADEAQAHRRNKHKKRHHSSGKFSPRKSDWTEDMMDRVKGGD